MLTIDTGVLSLFRIMMQIPSGAKVFLYNVDRTGEMARPFIEHGCKVSAVCSEDHGFYKYHKGLEYYDRERIEVVTHDKLDMIKPAPAFQFSFGFPSLQDNAAFINQTDTMRHWQVSRTDPNYMAPAHLMGLEAMWNATLPGGFFGAVLPRQWMGRYMRFMKWWRENAPMVAKIRLPRQAVRRQIGSNADIMWDMAQKKPSFNPVSWYMPWYNELEWPIKAPMVSSGNWMLFIWQKPLDAEEVKRTNEMYFLTFKYSGHVGALKPMDSNNTGLEEEAVENCAAAFRKSDWSKLTIRHFSKYLNDSYGQYSASNTDQPIVLRSPSDMRILKVSDRNKPQFYTKPTAAAIALNPSAVHIKPGPPVKLYAYSPQAQAALLDLAHKMGYSRDELQKENNSRDGYIAKNQFILRLKSKSFIENREWILKTICDLGLTPYLTEQDSSRLVAEEKWLNIQLAPMRRAVKVASPDNGEEWETIYDDVDIRATFPELWHMWESRARSMKLHILGKDGKGKFAYGFQFEDIITEACKQSILNANVMGLGKTREVLFAMMLRGSTRNLIISPTRLIGVWQEEIETTIANYVRLVRRNWMGKLMSADVQVIQWARDCRPENLKTFNIISYENLTAVPKDAMFFKCSKCEYVVCSPAGCPDQPCPKCNHGRRKLGKEADRLAGNRKFKLKSTHHVSAAGKIMDTRVSSGNNAPPLVMMRQMDNVFTKITMVQRGMEEQWDESTRTNITVPIYKDEERKPHLKWTFSELLRNRFSFVTADETNYVNNPTAQRSLALNHKITGRSRIGITGTPVRGYPKSIANILNWIFKRSVFPDYRADGGSLVSGIMRFQKKYATVVQREGKTPKLVPKINQPELFQQEIAPLMLRHVRHEPDVAKDIPPRTPVLKEKIVDMDPDHRAYYQKWLSQFAEWWRLKRIEEDGQMDARAVNDLLVKIGYLINASSIPHFMLDELEGGDGALWASLIGKYESTNLTQKFLACTELIKKNVMAGDKTLVGCWRNKNLVLGRSWCNAQNPKIFSLKIDGKVSNKINEGSNRNDKQLLVDKFCYQDFHVMWAGIGTMKEGFNIPQSNHAILLDYTWEPADTEQFVGRMLRPAQKKEVDATFLCHRGTVDEYIAALVMLKWRSAQEGVDYQAFDDWNAGMVPDFVAFANAIVDNTYDKMRTQMWTEVDRLRKELEEE